MLLLFPPYYLVGYVLCWGTINVSSELSCFELAQESSTPYGILQLRTQDTGVSRTLYVKDGGEGDEDDDGDGDNAHMQREAEVEQTEALAKEQSITPSIY
eukprot:scaffold112430_cov17-Tisochrysis_lutea.AAC.2